LAIYRCHSCTLPSPLCRQCIVEDHKSNIFHRILQWNEEHFIGVSAPELGLSLVLPCVDGHPCPCPGPRGLITILHVDGYHEIELFVCQCANALSVDLQLFRARLFAASIVSPRTAITFEALEQFRILHLEGKLSAHSFTQGLARLTTNDYIGGWTAKVSKILSLFFLLIIFLGSSSRVSARCTTMVLLTSTQAR
jgi:hypothetical protein